MMPRPKSIYHTVADPLPSHNARRHRLSDSPSLHKGENTQELLQLTQTELAREKQEHRRTWQDAATQVGIGRFQRSSHCRLIFSS